MPELPEVEAYRRFFRTHAAGRTVAALEADPAIVRNATPAGLRRALLGRRFDEPERHGKWLICWTDGPALVLHFGMTGDLIWSQHEPERHRHDRLFVGLREGGELRFRDLRKFGGAWLAHDRAELDTLTGPLGPDALAVGRTEFLRRLGTRRGGAKAALMDQTFVAGVGNLLADEILWQARIHPRRRVETLDEAERRTLYSRTHGVLKEAVDRFDHLSRRRSWLLHVRGEPGAVCPRCGTPLERSVAAGRTTWHCPACQPAPAGGT